MKNIAEKRSDIQNYHSHFNSFGQVSTFKAGFKQQSIVIVWLQVNTTLAATITWPTNTRPHELQPTAYILH